MSGVFSRSRTVERFRISQSCVSTACSGGGRPCPQARWSCDTRTSDGETPAISGISSSFGITALVGGSRTVFCRGCFCLWWRSVPFCSAGPVRGGSVSCREGREGGGDGGREKGGGGETHTSRG